VEADVWLDDRVLAKPREIKALRGVSMMRWTSLTEKNYLIFFVFDPLIRLEFSYS
jgi:hypothetical protein